LDRYFDGLDLKALYGDTFGGLMLGLGMGGTVTPVTPAPTLTSASLASVPWRATAITLTGTGIVTGATVDMSVDSGSTWTACTSVVFGSSTSITATTPVQTTNADASVVRFRVTNPDTQSGILPGGNVTVFFQADFTALSVGGIAAGASGGSAFETSTGLRLSRASVATVQTSDRLAVAVSSDVARIGQPSSSSIMRGLVLEETRTNYLTQSRDMTNAAWSAGTATQTANYATSPDGTTSATRVNKTSGQFGNFQMSASPATSRFAWSCWAKATDNVSSFGSTFGGGDSISFTEAVPVGPNWSRFTWADPASILAGGGTYTIPVWNDTGAYDELVDFSQWEAGGFCTEAIISGASAGVRADERLWHPDLSKLAVGGVLRVGGRLLPKGANGDYSFTQYLFFIDSNNNATIDTGGNVSVKLGGTTATFSTPITWAATDLVEFFLECGDSVTTTLTTWINGGSPAAQTTTALAHVLSTGTIDLLCNGTSQQLSSWIQVLEVWP
jgi:hypothetical protein